MTGDELCQFCGRDPYHYEDIGTGCIAVAVVCCGEAIALAAAARQGGDVQQAPGEAQQSGGNEDCRNAPRRSHD